MPAQREVFVRPAYRLDAWFDDNGAFVGLMGWWEYDAFRYVEHLAIAPHARSGGFGSKILKKWMSGSEKPVFLEIDPVVDEITQRRLNFYQRLGFVENAIEHAQPHFQGTGETVPLRVLSFPAAMSAADFNAFRGALAADVWADIKPGALL